MDYNAHNREVEAVWKSMEENKPIRMPMITGVSDRFFMYHPETNPKHISFEEYSTNPRVMFELQAGFDRYRRLYIPGDHRMGYPQPEEKGWSVNVDFQNYYEAVWLGGKLTFIDGQVPYAEPILNEDNKEMLFEKGIPDPFSGLMGKGKEYYELFQEYKKDFILDGYPVENIGLPFLGTDGPFTIACELMGPAQMCVQLYEDPDFAHQLLNYITDANIERQKAWRRYLGFPEKFGSPYFADDSCLLLSVDCYKEFILPYHRKYVEALSEIDKPGMVHMCGDATRHYETIHKELNIGTFDTGFPVNHKELVRRLGPDVTIQGGPPSELVRSGTPEQIRQEAKRIIEEVKPYTRKFVLREGNDIAPGTPIENIEALYQAAKDFGQYQ